MVQRALEAAMCGLRWGLWILTWSRALFLDSVASGKAMREMWRKEQEHFVSISVFATSNVYGKSFLRSPSGWAG